LLLLLALPVIVALWLGPALFALRLSLRHQGRARALWAAAALLAALPFLALEWTATASTVRSYDGYCHHAPDIRYPCSLPRAVLDGALPTPFALVGYVVLGAPSFLWGCFALAPFWWRMRRR
jgi:hypothetical protein